ncbi:MAG: hypothetical protein RJA36_2434 [Pseudomonadota bacterium]|jgi:hypothetical protein
MKKILLSCTLGTLLCASAMAQDLALQIEHESVSLSADGVTRSTRFAERLIRRGQQSWIARILPAGAHEQAEHHSGGKGHKHMDTAAAARWVVRDDNGRLQVRLVDTREKMVVDVASTDYANIGFDGRWTTASQLLDPEQVRRMQPIQRSAPAGCRWYEGKSSEARVQVLWDERAGFPRRIESANHSGSQRSTLVARQEAMPATLPWTTLKGYVQKEYSDLLD